jgi:hypothetical protein
MPSSTCCCGGGEFRDIVRSRAQDAGRHRHQPGRLRISSKDIKVDIKRWKIYQSTKRWSGVAALLSRVKRSFITDWQNDQNRSLAKAVKRHRLYLYNGAATILQILSNIINL